MKSIKSRIMFWIILLALVPALLVGVTAALISYRSAVENSYDELELLADEGANRIHYQLEAYINIVETAGLNPALADSEVSPEEKDRILSTLAELHEFDRGNIINADGISPINGTDYSDREYFQKAMKGESFISDPLLSRTTGEISVIMAAPLWEGGVYGSKVIGCVYFSPPSTFLNDVMVDLQVNDLSLPYILNNEGTIIANVDPEVVKAQYNFINSNSGSETQQQIAEIHRHMINGETGVTYYGNYANPTHIAYAPIEADTGGWSLAIEVPRSIYVEGVLATIIMIIVLVAVSVGAAILTAALISKRIVKPIQLCSERIRKLSEGDVSSPATIIKAKDETGVLSVSTAGVVNSMNVIIRDIERILGEMSKGNFDVDTQKNANAYVGDFASLINAICKINSDISEALYKIELAAEQVSVGSQQVSGGSQELSQGAAEQASSIDELASTINDISDKTHENLEDCRKAKLSVSETTDLMRDADNQMQSMTNAMSRIDRSSEEITMIIKAIEDIAFQTNILALNASVEAARAGEAGKGFAVVADEVRNLASKSQEAVKNTSSLIGESREAVQEGIRITEETAATIERVVEASESVNSIVSKVADSSEAQTSSIRQITEGINQISSVVQNNSATAEESAATSGELNEQAQQLKTLVSHFNLKQSNA
ncbi:MAG: methyl-accepting chemotaxis protein [Oscillospiraceae bacterium]|nr:methyl-accepting chemotaxis protein [Oscillospiraceae bacterium]